MLVFAEKPTYLCIRKQKQRENNNNKNKKYTIMETAKRLYKKFFSYNMLMTPTGMIPIREEMK